MSRRAIATLIAAVGLCVPILSARAQQDAFTITDGSATFHMEDVRLPRTASGGGHCSFNTGSPATNHMFQNWFWIRGSGDSREYALSNQVSCSTFVNSARLVYDESISDGMLSNALRIVLQYTLHDLSSATGRTDDALLVISWSVTNLTLGSISADLFHYTDFDAGGGAPGDSGVIRGVDQQTQVITDAGGAAALPTRIECCASGVGHVGYRMEAFPSLRNQLTDNQGNGPISFGSPFGPGDYASTNQWTGSFSPFGQADSTSGSVTIRISTRCKADYNESGSLAVNDIFAFLTDWFAGCP